jgi:aspartyl protease family protein
LKDNISNLDFKRHRLGLTKELSVFNILNTYKKSSLKLKLEIIALIEVLRNTEQNYNEALGLIFKLEKVKDSTGLLTQLSKRELDSRVLSNVKRMEMASNPNSGSEIQTAIPKVKPSYYKRNKHSILIISGFLVLFIFYFTLSTFLNRTPKKNYNNQKITTNSTYIQLIPEYGHKFVNATINGTPTTFMLDTGATTSTISRSYLNKHIRSGFVSRYKNFIKNAYYTMASGNRVSAEVWRFPSIKIGPKTIYNVEIAVMDEIGSNEFLLGMSTINKLGKTTIDLNENKIIIK